MKRERPGRGGRREVPPDGPRSPRFARRLLMFVLPPDVRRSVCGDVEELYHRRCASHGRWRARMWYRWQVVPFALRFLWERLRERSDDREARRAGAGAASPVRRRDPGRSTVSLLDVKLGARMLVKHPGLTVVGGLGMAVAIAIGAGFFDLMEELDSPLPFDEGERIVAIEVWDREINNQERRILHDFARWREELESVEELGAWRAVGRNLITEDGSARPAWDAWVA